MQIFKKKDQFKNKYKTFLIKIADVVRWTSEYYGNSFIQEKFIQ